MILARAALLIGSTVLVGAATAAEEEQPDLAFLEYLGMWEESDEEWQLFDEASDDQPVAENEERSDPVPQGKESRSRKMKVRHLISLGMLLLSSLAMADDAVKWDDLTDDQKQVLGQFESDWSAMSAERQQRLMLGADRFASMNDEQRAAARQRFQSWQSWQRMSDERRDLIRERYEIYQSLSPSEKRRIRDNFRRFNQLNRDRRQMMKDRFRNMTPEQRRRVRDKLRDRPRPTNIDRN